MLSFLRYRYGRVTPSERGQVLLIFAAAFAIVIMMLALLFDGARGVVLRRQLQDTSDAAALAAANVIQGLPIKGCSATFGPPPGAPQAAVVDAAKASVHINMPDYDLSKVVVTCSNAANTDNYAVQVRLGTSSPSFFGSIFGTGPLTVNTSSSAINGATTTAAYSVVLLNPSNPTWAKGNGCPSFGTNGGITANFDKTIYIDSSCAAADGGAFASKGGSASLTFGTGGGMRIYGEYKPQALTVTPAPIHVTRRLADPLGWLTAPPVSSIKVRSASKLVINGSTPSKCTSAGLVAGTNGCILEPGVYIGGIQLKSTGTTVFLRPGVYVMKDGGFDLGAGSKAFTIAASKTTATETTWASTDCPASTCGVLLYKTTVSSNDAISVTASSTFMVRAYVPEADTTVMTGSDTYDKESYRNLLIWQDAFPTPSSSYAQPEITLQGGGTAVLSGGVYAPKAAINMGGNPGGSGGSVDLTLQFISWDLNLSGNASFHFIYKDDAFPRPLDYGLIQ